jgi:hypothetical protein
MVVCLYFILHTGKLQNQIANTKIQNLKTDSDKKQADFDYLQKEIIRKSKTSDSLTALSMRDSLTISNLQAENNRLKQVQHEKYTAINRMSGHQLFDFFAKLDTGSFEGK